MFENPWLKYNDVVSKDDVLNPKPRITPLEPGTYEARLEQFEPSESKKGLPMIKGRFRLKNNRIIFYNQMLQNTQYPNMTAVNIAAAVKTVGQLLGEKIEFENMGSFAELIDSIPLGGLYKIEVTYGKKDIARNFTKIQIIESICENKQVEKQPTVRQPIGDVVSFDNPFGNVNPFGN